MPIIMFYAKNDWLPTLDQILRKDFEHPTKAEKTRQLMMALPAIVINAVNSVDGSDMSADMGLLVPVTYHPWAQNVASDIWIDIQPSDIDAPASKRKDRRMTITQFVRDEVQRFMLGWFYRPSFDVECRPLDATGIAINQDGLPYGAWGGIDLDQERSRDRSL